MIAFVPYFAARGVVSDVVKGRNPLHGFQNYKNSRGMSRFHDWFDWLGGYPFEVAKPEEVFEFAATRGFKLEWLRTRGGGMGNNEFVFVRE